MLLHWGGRWMEGCGGVHGGGRVSGLRAQLSLSQEAHPLGAAALITGGSSTPSPPCVSSPGDITHSGDVGLAQEGDTPTPSVAVQTLNRRHLTVRHGAHHG